MECVAAKGKKIRDIDMDELLGPWCHECARYIYRVHVVFSPNDEDLVPNSCIIDEDIYGKKVKVFLPGGAITDAMITDTLQCLSLFFFGLLA